MTTTEPRGLSAGIDPTHPRRAALPANPIGIWMSGWRLALRTGRREIGRARGRSALIMIMVGLPALLIIAVAVGSATPGARSQLGMLLGTAQGRIWDGDSTNQLQQDPQVQTVGSDQQKALAVPGHQPGSAWTPRSGRRPRSPQRSARCAAGSPSA